MSDPTSPRPATSPGGGLEESAADLFDAPGYRASVVELLGLLAYGELTAFGRMAADSELAPTLSAKAALARLATFEFAHFERLCDRLRELGADPDEAMVPFENAYDGFHDRTRPADWLEGLVKAYVGDGIASDFYREIAAYLDPASRELITEVLAEAGHAEFAVTAVRQAIAENPAVAGRLALWGRRLLGEALSQAQRVAADRDALTSLVVGSPERPGVDLAEIVQLFGRLTTAHTARMARLGLNA
jgi:hypothetical protein